MSRVELEVERNVLELNILLPDPPEVDRRFYADVWLPQETHHGLILDQLQQLAGLDAAEPNLTDVSFSLKLLGAVGKMPGVQDVSRMLYYLVGMATERSAVIAYNQLHSGLLELDERAVATTVVSPIRRQEPGHFAYYQIAARQLWTELSRWQKWLIRRLRKPAFGPVGVSNKKQLAHFGTAIRDLDIATGDDEHLRTFTRQVERVEYELLWAYRQGLRVPDYVFAAFKRAAEVARDQKGADRPPAERSGP
jgi:hypothetical protein